MDVFNYIYTDTIILTTSMPKYAVPKKKKKEHTNKCKYNNILWTVVN